MSAPRYIPLLLATSACLARPIGVGDDGNAGGDGDTAGNTAGDASRGTTVGTATGGPGSATATAAATATATATATSGSPTTGATTDVDDGIDTCEGAFLIDCQDHGVIECDSFAQDCPAGEKCMPFGANGGTWDSLRCSPISPNAVGLGDECIVEGSGTSGVDNCDLGLMCWGVDGETNAGTCIALCGGDPQTPQCPAATECLTANDGTLSVCLPTCDPLVGCPDAEVCVPSGDRFWCAPSTVNPGAVGDLCEFVNACEAGLSCVNAAAIDGCNGAGCCATICDLTAPDPDADCLPDLTCVPWFDQGNAPPELAHVGVCATAP